MKLTFNFFSLNGNTFRNTFRNDFTPRDSSRFMTITCAAVILAAHVRS